MNKTDIQKRVISEVDWNEVTDEKIDKIFRIVMDMEENLIKGDAMKILDAVTEPIIQKDSRFPSTPPWWGVQPMCGGEIPISYGAYVKIT